MNTTLYKASSRGHFDHGWLDTYHTFSFANYYDPYRVQFGALRVINDDVVTGGMGFDTHPHNNMEIISIPLLGDLEHKDSMGNTSTIREGDVQVMSAGTGVLHSEYNPNSDRIVNFFQIWVFPDKRDVEPRYQQMSLDYLNRKNELVQIVSPNADSKGLWIHQQAWFSIGTFDKSSFVDYMVKRKGNGVFAMVIEGNFTIGAHKLHRRDGLSIADTDVVKITSDSDDSRILLIDVPLDI